MPRRLLILLGVLWVLANAFVTWPATERAGDFAAFVASAVALQRGENPYAAPDTILPDAYAPADAPGPNRNPPLLLLVFAPLASADRLAALRALYLLSLAMYIACLAGFSRLYPAPLSTWHAALALAPLWYTLHIGQIYVFLLLPVLGAWWFFRHDQPLLAGVCVGFLVAIKPNFAVWLVLLLLGGQAMACLGGVLSAGILSAIPLAVYGPGIYRQWLSTVPSNDGLRSLWPTNFSLMALPAKIGLPELGIPVAALMLLATAFVAWRRRPDALRLSTMGLFASLLASPVVWLGYLLVLLPALLSRSLPWLAWPLLLLPVSLLPHTAGAVPPASLWLGVAYSVCLVVLFAHHVAGTPARGRVTFLPSPQSII